MPFTDLDEFLDDLINNKEDKIRTEEQLFPVLNERHRHFLEVHRRVDQAYRDRNKNNKEYKRRRREISQRHKQRKRLCQREAKKD